MIRTKDPFSISISLRHPSCRPEHISEALSIEPRIAHAVGDKVAWSRAKWKWTSVYAQLQEGDHVSEFEGALNRVHRFLEDNADFWAAFTNGGGEAELTLNHTIYPQEEKGDKNFELYLAPNLLGSLSTHGIGLRVQGWQGIFKRKRKKSATRQR